MVGTLVMAPKSVTFRRHDHLVSVLFGDLLSHSYNITFSMFLYLVIITCSMFAVYMSELRTLTNLVTYKKGLHVHGANFIAYTVNVNVLRLGMALRDLCST